MNFRFQQSQGIALESIVNTISGDGMKLMRDMLLWNPEKRPSGANVSLKHISMQTTNTFSHSNINTSKSPKSWVRQL